MFSAIFATLLLETLQITACASTFNFGYRFAVQYYLVPWDFSIDKHSNSEFTSQLSCILNVNSSSVRVVGIQPKVGWDIASRYALYVFLSSGQFPWSFGQLNVIYFFYVNSATICLQSMFLFLSFFPLFSFFFTLIFFLENLIFLFFVKNFIQHNTFFNKLLSLWGSLKPQR